MYVGSNRERKLKETKFCCKILVKFNLYVCFTHTTSWRAPGEFFVI